MGQVSWGSAKFYLQCFLTVAFVLCSTAFPQKSKSNPPASKTAVSQTRDPRQLTVMVTDFDGTLAHNVGYYVVRRFARTEPHSTLFQSVPTSLPLEVKIPIHDFEGNIGPQISKRLGKVDETGHFTPSTSLEPVRLSNGESLIPGYYYFDRQLSLREFSPPEGGDPSYLVTAIKEKLKSQKPFLLDAFPIFSVALRKEFQNRVSGVALTYRGHAPEEMGTAFGLLQKAMEMDGKALSREAFVNLSHPDFAEFSASKGRYIELLINELTTRVMADKTTPHFVVVFENDRKHLAELHRTFEKLSARGVFANPVVPILANLVEREVLENPDGHDWDRVPMREVTKMSRVTVYWPDRVERHPELSKILEITLGMSPEEAQKTFHALDKHPLKCSDEIIRNAFAGGK